MPGTPIGVSSSPLTAPGNASTGASFTGSTVSATVVTADNGPPLPVEPRSSTSTLMVSAPVKSANPWYCRLASVALTSATVPSIVSGVERLPSPPTVANPEGVAVSVPLATSSVTLIRPAPASTSVMTIPATAISASSLPVTRPGPATNGASLTGSTVTPTAPVSSNAPGNPVLPRSLTDTATLSAPTKSRSPT